MELAIDTSTATAGVALSRQGRVLAEHIWRAEYNHTRHLTPVIEFVLHQQGIAARDLHAIAVATGPGSFSGLRVGVSAAKGMAESLDIPLVGIGTLWVEAYPFASHHLPIVVVLDAGRGELAVGRFSTANGRLQETEPPRIATLEGICASIRQRTLFCGEHMPFIQGALAERLGSLAVFPSAAALLRRPGHLAELAWQRLVRGERDDAATLQPIYVRGPSITRPGLARAVRQ